MNISALSTEQMTKTKSVVIDTLRVNFFAYQTILFVGKEFPLERDSDIWGESI